MRKIIYLLSLIVIIILFIQIVLSLSHSELRKYDESIMKIAPEAFKKALFEEVNYRVDDNNLSFYYFYDSDIQPTEYITTYTENDTTKVLKSDHVAQLPREEYLMYEHQSYLYYKGKYLNVPQFDSIFASHLNNNSSFNIQTAILYIDSSHDSVIYSNSDPKFYKKAHELESVTVGTKGEFTLKGYYYLSIQEIFRELYLLFIAIITIVIVLVIILVNLMIKLITAIKIQRKNREPKYQLTENLYFDSEAYQMYETGGKPVRLTKQMVQLLEFMLAQPGMFAEKSVIYKEIWGSQKDPSNRLPQLIRRTRETLLPFEEINIVNITNSGYQIEITPK